MNSLWRREITGATGHHRCARKKHDSSTKSVMKRRKKCRCKKYKKTLFSKKPMDTPHKTSWRVTRRVKNCAQNCCCFSCLAPPLHRKAYGTATFAARHNCHWSGERDFARLWKKTKKTTFSKNTMDTPHKTSWRVTRSVGNSAGNHS